MNGSDRQLAVIEVEGKQRWVFETDRLRDAVGASYLVASLKEIAEQKLPPRPRGDLLLSTSGFAEALFDTRADAADWIDAVTRYFAVEAPGMEVCGVVVQVTGALKDARSDARKVAQQGVRARLARRDMTDRGLPWQLPCHYSGRPALDAKLFPPPEHVQGRRGGAGVHARRVVFRDSRRRVEQWLASHHWPKKLVDRINHAWFGLHPDKDEAEPGLIEPLAEPDTWRGVVHADGSGIGAIFKALDKMGDEGLYRARLKDLSDAVERLGWAALGEALLDLEKVVPGDWWERFPVYPLIVGGDDLTLVTDGRYAIFLARRYLHHFEEVTRGDEQIQAALKDAGLPQDRLYAGAGVAIVKHHFPFRLAYNLAEALCKEAKASFDVPTCSIDWHVVYDASPPDLDELRHRLRVGDKRLTRRPYAVGSDRAPNFDSVVHAAKVLREVDEHGRLKLPAAQLNDLRDGLFRSDGKLRLEAVRGRCGKPIDKLLADVHGSDASDLFVQNETGFLDVFDTAAFLKGFEEVPS